MIQLDDWQKEVLSYEGDILLCTGRRVGKTYILARKACEFMLKHPKVRVGIASLTEEQAMLINNMMLNILTENARETIGKGKNKPTLKSLTTKNGSRCIVRPVGASGDAFRGYEFDILIVDEASRMPELFWNAAKPTILTRGGKIWMSSTPYLKRGYFYDRFKESFEQKDPKARFKVIYVTTEQVFKDRAITSTWTQALKNEQMKMLENDKKEMSHITYCQEYLGLFMEDITQYFPDELIRQCQTLKRTQTAEDNFMGVDIARFGGDKCAYEILHKRADGKIIQIENITKQYQPTNITESDIINYTNIYKVDKIAIDAGAGSLGVGIFDNLMVSPISRKVVAINNRAIALDREGKKLQRLLKEDLYDNLKSMMEKGEIELLDDDSIFQSLKSIQITPEEEGRISKIRIYGRDNHITEGLIRAAWIAKKEKINKVWITYI